MSPVQIQTYAPLVAMAVMLPLFLLRNRRPRTLNVDRLWMAPTIVTALITAGLWFGRPAGARFDGLEAAIYLTSLSIGAAAGWWRGKLMRLDVDADDQTLKVQASPAGVLFVLALVVARQVLRSEAEAGVAQIGFHPGLIVEGLMLFIVAMVIAQRVELWTRARRLLGGAGTAAVA